jgi:hypothetical protein
VTNLLFRRTEDSKHGLIREEEEEEEDDDDDDDYGGGGGGDDDDTSIWPTFALTQFSLV